MSVYVDELHIVLPGTKQNFKYPESCHLMADSEKELEDFAKKLGLRKAWKHEDHYDLTQNKRQKAIKLGAIETTSRELAKKRRVKALAVSQTEGYVIDFNAPVLIKRMGE